MNRKVYKDGVYIGNSSDMDELEVTYNIDRKQGIVVSECNSMMFNDKTNVDDLEFIIPTYVFVSENYKRHRDGHLKNLEEFIPFLPKYKALRIPKELGLQQFMQSSALFENCITSSKGSIWIPKIRLYELDKNLNGDSQEHITLVRAMILKILVEYQMPNKDFGVLIDAVNVPEIDSNQLEDRLKETKNNLEFKMKFECFKNYIY